MGFSQGGAKSLEGTFGQRDTAMQPHSHRLLQVGSLGVESSGGEFPVIPEHLKFDFKVSVTFIFYLVK